MSYMATTYPQLELDVQLCLPLYAASRAITRRYGDLLAGTGLTYPQYLTMLALWSDAPVPVGDIGARLHLDTGTLTPLLKRLEQAGLVARRRDPADERRVLVEPTEAGWALRERVTEVPCELGRSLRLTADEASQLRQTLYQMIDSLDTAAAEAELPAGSRPPPLSGTECFLCGTKYLLTVWGGCAWSCG
jgi:DNA-binding MarR family transcriptional regulator